MAYRETLEDQKNRVADLLSVADPKSENFELYLKRLKELENLSEMEDRTRIESDKVENENYRLELEEGKLEEVKKEGKRSVWKHVGSIAAYIGMGFAVLFGKELLGQIPDRDVKSLQEKMLPSLRN